MPRAVPLLLAALLASGCRSKPPAPPPENPEICDLSLFEPNPAGGCDWKRLRASTGEMDVLTTVASSCGALSIAWGPDRRNALLARALPPTTPSPTPTRAAPAPTPSFSMPTPSPTPIYEVDRVDFTTRERVALGETPEGEIVEFGWFEGRAAVISSVPMSTSPAIWARVREATGGKTNGLPACDPGGVYLFAKDAAGAWEFVKSRYGDCVTGIHAHPGHLDVGFSGLLTGHRTPYRRATKEERIALGTTAGGIVFESSIGEILAPGDEGRIRTPMRMLKDGRELELDLPPLLPVSGGARERCLLIADANGNARPRLYDLREDRLRFKSDTAVGASFWPIAEPSPTPTVTP